MAFFPGNGAVLPGIAVKQVHGLIFTRDGRIENGSASVLFLYEENHSQGEWFKRSLKAMM